MGFAREQVERGLRQIAGPADIGTLIMWMVANPSVGHLQTPAASAAGATGAAEKAAETAAAPEEPALKAVTAQELQAQVKDMLQDILARVLALGRLVPKTVPVVAETMSFFATFPTPLWPGESGGNAEAVVKACLAQLESSESPPPADALACATQVLANLLHRHPQVAAALGEGGVASLLGRLHGWALTSAGRDDESADAPFARGYRTLCLGAAAPAPTEVGYPLAAAPAWLTPVVQ